MSLHFPICLKNKYQQTQKFHLPPRIQFALKKIAPSIPRDYIDTSRISQYRSRRQQTTSQNPNIVGSYLSQCCPVCSSRRGWIGVNFWRAIKRWLARVPPSPLPPPPLQFARNSPTPIFPNCAHILFSMRRWRCFALFATVENCLLCNRRLNVTVFDYFFSVSGSSSRGCCGSR